MYILYSGANQTIDVIAFSYISYMSQRNNANRRVMFLSFFFNVLTVHSHEYMHNYAVLPNRISVRHSIVSYNLFQMRL